MAIWTAAEPSIAVVSACLPSLRPLFVRVVLWGKTHRARKPSPLSYPDHHHGLMELSSSPKERSRKSFKRLQECARYGGRWQERDCNNKFEVHGGKDSNSNTNGAVEDDGYGPGSGVDTIERSPADTEVEPEVPAGRIRLKTEVIVSSSDRIDWKDDLF